MAEVTLLNLTPHPINLYGDRPTEDGPEHVIPPSGQVARVSTREIGGSDQYVMVAYSRVEDLPEPALGVLYVVSLVVALAARGRDDLLAPYREVRNESGTVIGCRTLQMVV